MANEQHIWNAAQNMIDRYGDDAVRHVDLRIEELRQHNKPEAEKLWQEIRRAVQELLERPAKGEKD